MPVSPPAPVATHPLVDNDVIDLSELRASVALTHDYLTQRGGAERVVLQLLEAFPDAPLHTSFFHRDGTFPEIDPARIRTMPINALQPLRHRHRSAFPVLAPAWSRNHVEADVVLCSSSGWAHGVHVSGRKIVYCHAPARWLYQRHVYLKPSQRLQLSALAVLSRPLKSWDRRAALSADRYIVNSGLIRDMVRRVYGIDAEVVPPPVTIDVNALRQPLDRVDAGYYLCVSRLLPYKNVDVLVDAFGMLGSRLVVVGEGPELENLQRGAPSNVRFVGRVSDAELRWLYANCIGNVSASYEDFGLTTLEAAVFGKPTIGLRYGGFLDTVIEGETGLLIEEPDAKMVMNAVLDAATTDWDADTIAAHARTFGKVGFQRRLRQIVAEEASLA
jgi:glycosyltransferase involved in cell wall biosynthesis